MSACRSCGAAIVWATTSGGKPMPVDADPTPDGTVVLFYASPGSVPGAIMVDRGQPMLDDPPRYVSHFATCPDADHWRTTR